MIEAVIAERLYQPDGCPGLRSQRLEGEFCVFQCLKHNWVKTRRQANVPAGLDVVEDGPACDRLPEAEWRVA